MAGTRFVEVLVGEHDVLILRVLVALHDLTPRDLDVLLLAEPLLDDPAAVLLVRRLNESSSRASIADTNPIGTVTRPKLMEPFQSGRAMTYSTPQRRCP